MVLVSPALIVQDQELLPEEIILTHVREVITDQVFQDLHRLVVMFLAVPGLLVPAVEVVLVDLVEITIKKYC